MKSNVGCCHFVMATDKNKLKQNKIAALAGRSRGSGVDFLYFARHSQTPSGRRSDNDLLLQFFCFLNLGK